MPNLILYGTPDSTYVRTTRLLLDEAGIEYALNSVDIFNGENHTEAYLAKHPFGKVPTLVVDDQVLYETGAIAHYLNQAIAKGQFMSSNVWTQARTLQVMSIVDNYLYAPAVGSIVIQRLIVPQQGGQSDEDAVNAAIAPAKKALLAIEDLMEGTPFLMGTLISLADFYLIPIVFYLEKTPEFEILIQDIPNLKTWWNQVKGLNSVQRVCV